MSDFVKEITFTIFKTVHTSCGGGEYSDGEEQDSEMSEPYKNLSDCIKDLKLSRNRDIKNYNKTDTWVSEIYYEIVIHLYKEMGWNHRFVAFHDEYFASDNSDDEDEIKKYKNVERMSDIEIKHEVESYLKDK